MQISQHTLAVKYGEQLLTMPAKGIIVDATARREAISLWVRVADKEVGIMAERRFYIARTGEIVPYTNFVKTLIIMGGDYVWHGDDYIGHLFETTA